MHSIVACFLLSLAAGASVSPDQLFQRMAGRWHGEGKRLYTISGREIVLHSEASSEIEDGRLISHNYWVETPAGENQSAPREYTTDYWIRPAGGGTPGDYELGYPDAPNSPVASGRFADEKFEVTQELGGGFNLRIESTTVFSADSSDYSETAWHGATPTSHAKVHYSRAQYSDPHSNGTDCFR